MKKPASKKTSSVKLSLLQVIINALEDLKAQNIVTLDVSRLTYVTDTLVIASGSSSRQVRALAQNAVEDVKKNGMASIGIEGLDGGEWVLADFGDVAVFVHALKTGHDDNLAAIQIGAHTGVVNGFNTGFGVGAVGANGHLPTRIADGLHSYPSLLPETRKHQHASQLSL